MRKLTIREIRHRGCYYCEKRVDKWNEAEGCNRSNCPYEECPYRILDKFDTYEEFMESEDCKRQLLPT